MTKIKVGDMVVVEKPDGSCFNIEIGFIGEVLVAEDETCLVDFKNYNEVIKDSAGDRSWWLNTTSLCLANQQITVLEKDSDGFSKTTALTNPNYKLKVELVDEHLYINDSLVLNNPRGIPTLIDMLQNIK